MGSGWNPVGPYNKVHVSLVVNTTWVYTGLWNAKTPSEANSIITSSRFGLCSVWLN